MHVIRHPKTLVPLNNPRFLPNRDGFRFIGVKLDGSEVECVIRKKEDGTHCVSGAVFSSLLGWRV